MSKKTLPCAQGQIHSVPKFWKIFKLFSKKWFSIFFREMLSVFYNNLIFTVSKKMLPKLKKSENSLQRNGFRPFFNCPVCLKSGQKWLKKLSCFGNLNPRHRLIEYKQFEFKHILLPAEQKDAKSSCDADRFPRLNLAKSHSN